MFTIQIAKALAQASAYGDEKEFDWVIAVLEAEGNVQDSGDLRA